MKNRVVKADVRLIGLALEVERIRTEDPECYERIMRKLAELERKRK